MTNSKGEALKNTPVGGREIVPEATESLILEKTPQKYIRTRPGPSGKSLSYVEVGYVVDRLNKIFNYNWSFEITERTIGKRQIEVKGRLTGRFYHPDTKSWVEVVKEQYGGIDIKFNKITKEMVSIADDLKAASSDALKKCASLFGIAQDLYWTSGGEHQEPEQGRLMSAQDMREKRDSQSEIEEQEAVMAPATQKQKSLLSKLYEDGKIERMTGDEFEGWLEDLDIAGASNAIAQVIGEK